MLTELNLAIEYIEERLSSQIDYAEAARLALCSEYHFRRMFSSLAGVSLSEYVRRRRLTLAAFDLSNSDIKVIDVALKYGYDSPDSFARAFQSMHGVTPSEARVQGQLLMTYPRINFQLTVKGGTAMNYRIVNKEAFRIVGIMKRVPLIYNGVNPEIAAMYQSLTPELISKLKGLSNIEPRGIISASANFSEGRHEGGELDHYVGVATTIVGPKDLANLDVDASTWAVFEACGAFPAALQEVWGRIYAEWFPSSGYELAIGPEILWNEGKDTSAQDYRSEIWIPVCKK